MITAPTSTQQLNGLAVQPDRHRHRGSSGIGLETARQAHVAGADLDFDEALRALDEDLLGAPDVAAVAIHLMTNTAVTGATYDVDGGQQLIP